MNAELHLGALARKQNRRDLHEALNTLPKDLHAIYEETMKRIFSQDTQDVQLALRILAWISFSPEPLKVEELQHALAIEPGTKQFDWDLMIEDSVLVSVCGGLVTVDRGSRVIRLVHFTTQEYLRGIEQDLLPTAKHDITVSCLTYLLYRTFASDVCDNCRALNGHPQRDCPCAECRSNYDDEWLEAPWCRCYKCQAGEALVLQSYALRNWSIFARALPECDATVATFIEEMLMNERTLTRFINQELEEGRLLQARDCGPLHVAAYVGLKIIVKKLLTAGYPVDTLDCEGNSALYYAAKSGQDEIVELLLRAGSFIDRQNHSKETPLLKAISADHTSTLRLLLENNALTEVGHIWAYRPLVLACEEDAEDAVRHLLNHGARLTGSFDALNGSCLHCAKSATVAKLLLDKGADVNAIDSQRCTPLHVAIMQRKGEDFVGLLIDYGADVDAIDGSGMTPLLIAENKGNADIVQILIKRAANVDLADRDGTIPLHTEVELAG